MAFDKSVDPGGVEDVLKLWDIVVFAKPFEIVIIGVKDLDFVLVAKQLPQKQLNILLNSAELIDDEDLLDGGHLNETNERFIMTAIMLNIYSH